MGQQPKKEGALTKATTRAKGMKGIDLNLRIKNDGGPLFSYLVAIEDAHVRGDRIRQLLYLGLLRERELTGGGALSSGQGAVAIAPVRAASTEIPLAPKDNSHPTTNSEPAFEADDLAAIFQ